MPGPVTTMVLRERRTPRTAYVHLGGDFTPQGRLGRRRRRPASCRRSDSGKHDRLDLARWLVDGKHPLTARVAVNRIWQQYFGLGLVETENDFGTQGIAAAHPELLDWLAVEFVRRGWTIRRCTG